MSRQARAGRNANAALLCNVVPEDFPDPSDPLSGIAFQRSIWERAARARRLELARAPADARFLPRPFLPQGHRPRADVPARSRGSAHQLVSARRVEGAARRAIPFFSTAASKGMGTHALLTGVEARNSSLSASCATRHVAAGDAQAEGCTRAARARAMRAASCRRQSMESAWHGRSSETRQLRSSRPFSRDLSQSASPSAKQAGAVPDHEPRIIGTCASIALRRKGWRDCCGTHGQQANIPAKLRLESPKTGTQREAAASPAERLGKRGRPNSSLPPLHERPRKSEQLAQIRN